MPRLDHVGIHAEDAPAMARWLGETLGLPLVRHSVPGHRNHVAFYSCGNANLEFVAPASGGGHGGGNRLDHVALGVDDLDAALAKLRERGVHFQGDGPVTSPSRTMQMSDPATTGTVFQVIQWFPPSAGGDLPPVEPPERRGDGIGVVKLDHVGLLVADMAAGKRRLVELMGFPIAREGAWPERQRQLAFFSLDNAEIEAIALDDPAEQAAQLGDRAAQLDHIALQVADLDAAAVRLRATGVEFESATPQSRGNRRMYFTRRETSHGIRFQLLQDL